MGHTVGSNTHPQHHVEAEAFYKQGESLANLGRYREALVAFDQAIATPTGNTTKLAATWVFRAVVLIHLQSYDEALSSCDRALELEPRHVEAWVFRGVALNYLEQYPDSYESYAKAMKLAQPQKASLPNMSFSNGITQKLLRSYTDRLSQARWRLYIRAHLQNLWQQLKRLRFHH